MAKLRVLVVNLRVSAGNGALDLGDEECSVVSASGIDAARDCLSKIEVDAVFLDFDFPSRSTLVHASALKQEFAHVPMVMTSVEHSEELILWAFRSRLWDFLTQPVPAEELARCIATLKVVRTNRCRQERRALVEKPRTPAAVNAPERGDLRLLKVVYYVERHLHTAIRSSEMAKLCGLSTFHFSRVFKERFGMGFREYLLGRRLTEARKLLTRDDAVIMDVAVRVGFNDAAYFSRAFRRFFGISPSEALGTAAPARGVENAASVARLRK